MTFTLTFTDIFLILLLLLFLQPVVRQWLLQRSRVRVLRAIEQKRRSRVIALIHRQETLSLLGFPLARFIDINDSEQVLRAIKLTAPDVPIDLILHTPGGLVLAAEQIARALRRRKAPVTVFVPHYAMSGGTLIALAADAIVMDENAVLGPVDPQLGQYPAASIVKAVEQKSLDEIDDRTLILADVARKALRQTRETVIDLLTSKAVPAKRAEAMADKLASGVWTHDYPISLAEAQALGLPVSTDVPPEIYRLMALYPQAGARRPSVAYIPLPYAPPKEDQPGRS